MLSKYIIEAKNYASKKSDWNNSNLKGWLNSEFLDTVFKDIEKKIICDESGFGEIFILSKEEIINYSNKSVISKKAEMTPYADMRCPANGSPWWIRCDEELERIECIRNGGYTFSGRDSYIGVRPAMWIDLSAIE